MIEGVFKPGLTVWTLRAELQKEGKETRAESDKIFEN